MTDFLDRSLQKKPGKITLEAIALESIITITALHSDNPDPTHPSPQPPRRIPAKIPPTRSPRH
ncbi:MAG: hypothetical protein OHK0037_10290 [Elainellaceae cyanobacterium]